MGRAKQRAAEIALLKAKGPKVKEQPSIVPIEVVDQSIQINPAEIEAQHRAMWRGAIEQELQSLVRTASEVRQKIDTAKTEFKKKFYNNEFKKIQQKVMQMVTALQRIQAQEAAVKAAATPGAVAEALLPNEVHVHDERCGHLHTEEQQNGNVEAAPATT